jgi:hypothetical protein
MQQKVKNKKKEKRMGLRTPKIPRSDRAQRRKEVWRREERKKKKKLNILEILFFFFLKIRV